MICSKREVCASQEGLHLTDVGGFAIDELLGQIFDLAVMVCPLVHIPNTLDHAPGIAQNHHIRHFGIGIAVTELHTGHHVRHQPFARLQFRQFPTSLRCQGMGLTFDGIIFLKLGFQRFPEAGPQVGIQKAPDTNLAHLCGF